MKKITYCIILTYLQFSSLLMAWQVRVVPVCKDVMTGQWSGLFEHTVSHECSDFNQEGQNRENVAACAAQILHKHTHGKYAINEHELAKIKSCLTLDNRDVIYFVPVEYVPGPELQARRQKAIKHEMVEPTNKDRYVWLPFDELLTRKTIIKTARDKIFNYTFDCGIRTVIETHWNDTIAPSLNAMNYKKTQRALCSKKSFIDSDQTFSVAQISQRSVKPGKSRKA